MGLSQLTIGRAKSKALWSPDSNWIIFTQMTPVSDGKHNNRVSISNCAAGLQYELEGVSYATFDGVTIV